MEHNEIKRMLSKEVLPKIQSKPVELIFRRLAFNPNNRIDWDDLYEVLIAEMPEMFHFA